MLLGYMSSRIGIRKLIAVYMVVTAGLMVLFSGVTTFDAATLTLALLLGFFIFGSIFGLCLAVGPVCVRGTDDRKAEKRIELTLPNINLPKRKPAPL